MNLKTKLSVLALFLIFVASCYAQPAAALEKQAVQFEMENYYYNYSESIPFMPDKNFQPRSNEYGYVPGFKVSYLYQNLEQSGMDFRLSLSIANNSITYDGSVTNVANPYYVMGQSTAKFMDAQFLTNLYYFRGIELATYAGVGYHSWDRGVCMANGGSGYMENYSWGYIPVGIRREFMLSNELSIEPDISVRFMFAGKMSVPYLGTTMTLGNKYGANFQIPVQYRFDETFSGLITPWIDYSEIGQSDSVWSPTQGKYYYEPNSSTWQYGVNIGVRLNF